MTSMLLTERMISAADVFGWFAAADMISLNFFWSASRKTSPRVSGERFISSDQDDLSHGSVRFGHPECAVESAFAACSIKGRTLALSGSIQSEPFVHLVPSQRAI